MLTTLQQLYVRGADGTLVPLSTFVSIDTKPVQPLVVNHQSQFPSVTISYNLKERASLGDSVTAIQSSLRLQPYLIAAALVAVYIILGILYESYVLPLTILSTLPSAGVGALLMLRAFGYDLTVIATVRIILLIGIIKKTATPRCIPAPGFGLDYAAWHTDSVGLCSMAQLRQ